MGNRLADNVRNNQAPARRDIVIGIAAILLATTVWGSWIVITRFGVTGALTPYDAAFLRFTIPAAILLPVLLREGLALRRIGWIKTALMVAGAGAPAFLISTSGMQLAPAAHAGALLPGTMPLFVAVLAALFEGERIGPARVAGFALIVLGAIAIGGYSLLASAAGEWRGHLMFLTAAFLWAVYTLAFRRAGIGAWHAAALINFWSAVGFVPVYLLMLEPRLAAASWPELALQTFSQALLSGIVAIIAFGIAVRRLGAPRAAVFTSLTPVIAAVAAIVFLGEEPNAATSFGIVAVSLGVAMASGALGQRADKSPSLRHPRP